MSLASPCDGRNSGLRQLTRPSDVDLQFEFHDNTDGRTRLSCASAPGLDATLGARESLTRLDAVAAALATQDMTRSTQPT